MPCSKKPIKKLWDQPKKLRTVTPSKYELQTDPRAVEYWKNLVTQLEISHYSDNDFWQNKGDQVHGLVGDTVFERLRKIFNLPKPPVQYEMIDDESTLVSSADCYNEKITSLANKVHESFSMSDVSHNGVGTEDVEEESWSSMTEPGEINEERHSVKTSRSTIKSMKTISQSSKILGRSRSFTSEKHSINVKSFSNKTKSDLSAISHSYSDTAKTGDDLFVHTGALHPSSRKRLENPYHEMLYCNESETDMIKWDSNYKAREIEKEAVDKTSVQAELKTKEIAKEFFDWWITTGSVNYKSEIRKPEDIEELSQLWLDEHQSRGLIIDNKIMPCVSKNIANYIQAMEWSCKNQLKKYVSLDIAAEAIPCKTLAFGKALPKKDKHIPPKNNTDKVWNCLKIPKDLQSMACVWEDIQHLTSTKSFKAWLELHPTHSVPAVLEPVKPKRSPRRTRHIEIGSGTVMRDDSSTEFGLTIPFSQVNIQLNDVLAKLMNQ